MNDFQRRGTPFHRILAGYWCQGGDVTKFNGVGGASIYDEALPDENFSLQHSCPGVLSTYIDDKNACDSKFNLTFRPLRTMDGKKIVFGKVVKGIQNIYKVMIIFVGFFKLCIVCWLKLQISCIELKFVYNISDRGIRYEIWYTVAEDNRV